MAVYRDDYLLRPDGSGIKRDWPKSARQTETGRRRPRRAQLAKVNDLLEKLVAGKKARQPVQPVRQQEGRPLDRPADPASHRSARRPLSRSLQRLHALGRRPDRRGRLHAATDCRRVARPARSPQSEPRPSRSRACRARSHHHGLAGRPPPRRPHRRAGDGRRRLRTARRRRPPPRHLDDAASWASRF